MVLLLLLLLLLLLFLSYLFYVTAYFIYCWFTHKDILGVPFNCISYREATHTYYFDVSSFIKFVEDALPLIGNKTLRDRLLRIGDDYAQLRRDQQLLADLFGNTTGGTVTSQKVKFGSTGADAGGCTGCTCTPPHPAWEKSSTQKCPKEERKFGPDISAKKKALVPLRYHKIKMKKLGKKRRK